MILNNPRWVLIIIALLFLTPLGLALMMRSGWWNFQPSSLSNRGVLVQPPIRLPIEGLQTSAGQESAAAQQNWVMLYRPQLPCAVVCQDTIRNLRQIHLATGRHQDRVSGWVMTDANVDEAQAELISRIYPAVVLWQDADGVASALLNQWPLDEPGDSQNGEQISATNDPAPGQVFLLDPAGHIILRYPGVLEPGDIKQDLDRLLTWSAQP